MTSATPYAQRLEALYEGLQAEVFRDEKDHNAHPVVQRFHRLRRGILVHAHQSPYTTFLALTMTFLFLTTFSWAPWNHRDAVLSSQVRHAMIPHSYSPLEVDYNFKIAEMETQHWCLFGNDQQCPCEDPTHGEHRGEFAAWVEPHERNVDLVATVSKAIKTNPIDVVFIGDEMVQSWTGKWFNQRCPSNVEILAHWNRTFGEWKPANERIRALRLGISGDRVSGST